LNVISNDLAAKLLAYVQQGGHLLLGPRSGMKNEFDALQPERQPGPLVEALGGRVEQYYALDQPLAIRGSGDATADIWAEQLSTSGAAVLLTYGAGNGWLEGKPAMITRDVGKGSIAYLGTLPDAVTLRNLLTREALQAGAPPVFSSLPDEIELCVRGTVVKRVLILINHGDKPAEAIMDGRLRNLLPDVSTAAATGANNQPATRLTLPSQGVAVLTAEPNP